MIDHTGIQVSDFGRSKDFYIAALAPLGYGVLRELPDAAGFGAQPPGPNADPHGAFWITAGTPTTPRIHIAFSAAFPEQVRAFHAAALSAGGRDNGVPGLRPQYHAKYYAAFILDPDGYNIEAVCHRGQQ